MTRPQKQIISRERAAKAALDVVDVHGLEGFSLKLVADRLGVKAPSFYHHFKSRDELLTEATRLLLVRSKAPPLEPGLDWRPAVVATSQESWRSVLRHPRAAPLLLQFFPRHLMVDDYENWLAFFALQNIPPDRWLWILEGAEKLTLGSALFAAAARSRSMPPFPSYNSQQHPLLTAAIRANNLDEEDLFLEAMRSFLRGIPDAVQVRDRRRLKARA